jgi:hypothetical protein
MTRVALFIVGMTVLAAVAAAPALALTASDCAKFSDPRKRDECVRSLPTAGKSGTTPAVPADPRGSGPATPAVPGKEKAPLTVLPAWVALFGTRCPKR